MARSKKDGARGGGHRRPGYSHGLMGEAIVSDGKNIHFTGYGEISSIRGRRHAKKKMGKIRRAAGKTIVAREIARV